MLVLQLVGREKTESRLIRFFLSVLGFVALRLKSPVIIISFMPVSIARPIESSILERYVESELGGL